MRFADISCGSGSFLLGVFDCLLRYHTAWYNTQPAKERAKFLKNDCIQHDDGTLHLTLKKRREILLNNIFGVDVDHQATEVAQLSLYLKLLEDETTATARNYQLEMGVALLPSLSQNMVSGNSLVGTDILEEEDLFDEDEAGTMEEKRRLNPMDFEFAFRHIFKEKKRPFGFDVIVGNPPYVRPHKIPNLVKEYLWKKLRTFRAKSDLYSCFMERAIDLVAPNGGQVSFIVPHTWTSLESFELIRRKLAEETAVISLTQLPKKVFKDATVETCIFNCSRADQKRIEKNEVLVYRLEPSGAVTELKRYVQSGISKTHLHNFQLYAAQTSQPLLERLTAAGPTLGHIVEFAYGFKTADDEKFLSDSAKDKDHKPFIPSAAIGRYNHAHADSFVWYRPDLMKRNKKTARPGEAARFESEKLLVGRMGKRLFASYDAGGLYVKDAILILPKVEHPVPLKALLAIINSRFLGFIYTEFFVTIDVLKNALLGLPLPPAVRDEPMGQDMLKLEKLATQLMTAIHASKVAKNERDKSFYVTRATQLDAQIDDLVEQMYGVETSN